MSENNHRSRGFDGKGYYIALILCAVAIGITGYLYYQNSSEAAQINLKEPIEEVTVATAAPEDVPVLATQAPTTQPTETASPPAAKPVTKKVLQTTAPLAGESIYGYSMEALSYNQTTRDWRVHDGVDLAAETGSQVVAAAEGQVIQTGFDDAMGATVEIRHSGGYTTKYSSLAQELSVKAGDSVTMGQVIGTVGDTALVESALGSHVHFSVRYQDAPMDPEEFLALGK